MTGMISNKFNFLFPVVKRLPVGNESDCLHSTSYEMRIRALSLTVLSFAIMSVSVLSSALLLTSPAHADPHFDSAKEPTKVGLLVRTVMGNGLMTGRTSQPDGGQKRTVDTRLRDLASKLQKLQYREYSLLSSQDTRLEVTQKKVLHLPKGHSLAVRPLYIKGKRVGMWLKWKDGGGMKILDTRMHFTCGENMLTGTESGDDSGIILAISVNPVP